MVRAANSVNDNALRSRSVMSRNACFFATISEVGARAIRYTAFILANFEPGVEGHTVSDAVGETLTPLIRLPSKH